MPAASHPLAASPRPPTWAALVHVSLKNISALDAVFAAGASLAALDAAVRQNAAFAGAWRRRLALKAAVATLSGKAGDETILRDALALTRPGGDSGPAGRVYVSWRALGSCLSGLAPIAAGLGAPQADLSALAAIVAAHAGGAVPAPLAAAAAATAVAAAFARADALALAVADLVLAARLGWRAPLALLAAETSAPPSRIKPGDAGWPGACCAAYARAAASACDLFAQLAHAEARLRDAAPKLRAKGAPAAIAALLDEDAVSGAFVLPGLSDRGLRRLFDRLVELGAIRELTGRATFRLYGL